MHLQDRDLKQMGDYSSLVQMVQNAYVSLVLKTLSYP